MKRIIYTCDRCGKEIPDDRFHVTITKETADEPELIGESCYQDYCQECMTAAMVYLQIAEIKEEQVAPEETIELSEKTDKTIDQEDMEEPEESVMCELREAEAEQRKRRKWIDPEIRDRIIELFNSGEGVLVIAGRLGVDRKAVYNVIHRARKKGLVE